MLETSLCAPRMFPTSEGPESPARHLLLYLDFFAANALCQLLVGERMVFRGHTLDLTLNLTVSFFLFQFGIFVLVLAGVIGTLLQWLLLACALYPGTARREPHSGMIRADDAPEAALQSPHG